MSRPRFLADHNLNRQIIGGLVRREPAVSFSTLREWGLQRVADRDVLEFAASESLVVVSHDANTMTVAANARIIATRPMAGLIVAPQRTRVGIVIEDLLLIWAATEAEEWADQSNSCRCESRVNSAASGNTMPEGMLYLVRANDEVISYCRCETAPIAWPAQMDCPWCGCGWLFVCSSCGQAFTFARAEYIEEPIKKIAHRDLLRRRNEEPNTADIAEWVQVMRILQKGIQPGKIYVYLDGFRLPTDAQAIAFDGWAARHELAHLPHIDAMNDPKALDLTIGNRRYWRERAISDQE